ncbi:MAG: MBL fold metallo-hydrolase [Candidatus Methanofastidiosia archaeon]
MIKNLTITCIVDNRVDFVSNPRFDRKPLFLDFLAEWGFSLLIETENKKFLFDTGLNPKTLIHNADLLGITFSDLDGIILSHAHDDHTGGLKKVIKVGNYPTIYAHKNIFEKKFFEYNNKMLYVGIPYLKEDLECYADFNFNTNFVQITKDIYLTGEVPRKFEFESVDEDSYILTKNGFVKDNLLDDQSLVLDTKRGLVVVTGCVHAGVLNTLTHINDQLQKKIVSLIGGLHLKWASQYRLAETSKYLQKNKIKTNAFHCTGNDTASFLKTVLKDDFEFGCVGACIEVC